MPRIVKRDHASCDERAVVALSENAPVPWKPPFPSVPAHPARRFDFRVAEAAEDSGTVAGHLLVFAGFYAREAGHLWWKNLSDPRPVLELWSFIGGEWDEFSFVDADDVDAAVEDFERCQWQSFAGGVPTTLQLRWLDADESTRVATDVFGVDLNAERRRQRRGA